MARFICTTKNYRWPKLFRPGDIYNGSEASLPHDKKGNLQFFKPLDGPAPSKPSTAPVVKVNDQIAGETETTEDPASKPATAAPKKRQPRKIKKRRGFVEPKKADPAPLP